MSMKNLLLQQHLDQALQEGTAEAYQSLWDHVDALPPDPQFESGEFWVWIQLFDHDFQSQGTPRAWTSPEKNKLIDWSLIHRGSPPFKSGIGLIHYALSWENFSMLQECLSWLSEPMALRSMITSQTKQNGGILMDAHHLQSFCLLWQHPHIIKPSPSDASDLLTEHVVSVMVRDAEHLPTYLPVLFEHGLQLGDWGSSPFQFMTKWADVLFYSSHTLTSFTPLIRSFLDALEPYQDRPDVASVFQGLKQENNPFMVLGSHFSEAMEPLWMEYRSRHWKDQLTQSLSSSTPLQPSSFKRL